MNLYGVLQSFVLWVFVLGIFEGTVAADLGNESKENVISEPGRLDVLLDEITASRGLEVRRLTREEIEKVIPELLEWTPPKEISTKFPVYFSGYDEELRPLWIGEYGKWDLRPIVNGGREIKRDFAKYILALSAHVYKSMNESTAAGNTINDFVMLLDLDGWKTEFMTVPAIQYGIVLALTYRDVIVNHLGELTAINVNAVAQLAVDIGRPIIFSILADRMEVFGTNREAWIPALRKRYPYEIIPTWYGGPKDYKPVKVLG